MPSMIRTEKTYLALRSALAFHEDQLYGDLPYIVHLIAVAANVPDATETECVAALLHDVIEDTCANYEYVEAIFGKDVADIVSLLTKQPGYSYKESINRIIDSGNISAIKVKWADNKVNMSGDKSHMTEERRTRLENKYTESFKRLTEALEHAKVA